MDGFARSVGNGIGGLLGNAIGAIGGALRNALDGLSASMHGGGVVLVGIVALVLLAGFFLLRR